MNGRELYEHIKTAAKAFGLSYHEINLVEVEFFEGGVCFKFDNKAYTIKL